MFVLYILLQCLVCAFVHGDNALANSSVVHISDPSFGFELLLEKILSLEQRVMTFELSTGLRFNSLTAQVSSLNRVLDRVAWLTTKVETSTAAVGNRIDQFGHNISVIMASIQDLVAEQKVIAANLQSWCQGEEKPIIYSSCSAVPATLPSAVYTVEPEPIFHSPLQVFCEQNFRGGGWTVVQNRFNGNVNFYRDWQSYREGFGDMSGEFWLGLEQMRLITNSAPHELVVLLEDFDGNVTYARYNQFEVGGEKQNYALTKLGSYTGTAGDSMSGLLNVKFSTFDRDNDAWESNCAVEYTGAWWYTACHSSNLNGQYLKGNTSIYAKGMVWQPFRGYYYSLKSARMMVRRR